VPAALAAVVAVGSCTARPAEPQGAAPPPATATGSGASNDLPELSVRLVKLRASRVDGGYVRLRPLQGPAEAVRRSIEGLYRTAFVDPERWEDGEYTELFSHFSTAARERAQDDLELLTLGAAASEVDEVRPTRAIVKVGFLLNEFDRPIAAVADTEFVATAVADDVGSRIVHRAHYVLRRLNDTWRIVSYRVRGRVPRPAQGRDVSGEAAFAPGVPDSRPMFILVVGSDARPGQAISRTRADSIHIVGVDPRSGRASVLGIPRDSWVPIPGWGSDKINAALVRGGPELLVSTVHRLSGIRLDGYVLTGFWGFAKMVDAIGGIPIRIPYPINDPSARARFPMGTRRLDGRDALAFSRARHDVPRGDFSRSLNQGLVLVSALAAVRDQAAGAPAALLPWVAAGAGSLRTDLALDDLFGLALAATTLDPSRVRNAVVSGHTGTIAGKSVVLLDAGARAAFRDLARDGVLNS
jgi:LCP family protein required for cell wall assembly